MFMPDAQQDDIHISRACTSLKGLALSIRTAYERKIDPIRQKPAFRLVTRATIQDNRTTPPTRQTVTIKETARLMPTPTTSALDAQHRYFIKQSETHKNVLRNYLNDIQMD
jgi:hypothetical protein